MMPAIAISGISRYEIGLMLNLLRFTFSQLDILEITLLLNHKPLHQFSS